jgi:ADP-heptose:LPS heptosyltransferase/GT2 family glycosyltransferase
VTILFGEYELLSRSGLFDAEFYVRAYPEIAKLNIDPLMHYIERGGREGLDPSADFDTAHYLNQCGDPDEKPANPLYHYLTIGIARGLTIAPLKNPERSVSRKAGGPKRRSTTAGWGGTPLTHRRDPSKNLLSLDIPRALGGMVESPIRGGLSVIGWAIADAGVEAVDVALDGRRVATARYGLRRPDVAAAHPSREGSLLSGYAVHLPPKALTLGAHEVAVSMLDRGGNVTSIDFRIVVQETPDVRGPWALRLKMSQAEVDLKLDTLAKLNWHPTFRVVMPLALGAETIVAARRTIEALRRQTYSEWELSVLASGDGGNRTRDVLFQRLLENCDDIAEKIHLVQGTTQKLFRAPDRKSKHRTARFLLHQVPGDELGCDAFLELSLASGFNPEIQLWYSDERRTNPVDGKLGAFFKPGWSPDLLLSTNYFGRAWYADMGLFPRSGIDLSRFDQISEYDMALRLTEATQTVGHVPKVLHERSAIAEDTGPQEHDALVGALKRRGIDGEVLDGAVGNHYRIKRRVTPERVSIIVPTCACKGLIRNCLDSLRDRTTYDDYEVICIENISDRQKDWRGWLRSRADQVITTREPFNWSKFNNDAAGKASGNFLLFLNDDTEIIDPDWLQALLEHAQRPEVGAVGPLLLYPDCSVQHAGVFLDYEGRGRHAFRHLLESDPGYFGLAHTQRNVISVTGACLMTRCQTFNELGRFDESHSVINNDLDYCLKAWQRGLLNVYTPHSRLIHHELASRVQVEEKYDVAKFRERWRGVIARGDPYFNTNLSRDHDQFVADGEPLETVYAGHPLFEKDSVRRILVVKLDHIGDCINALPAVRRLRHHFPKASICVLAGRATLPIWNAEAAVDETMVFGFFHPRSGLGKLDIEEKERKGIEETLRARRFDLAIDLRKQPDTREVLLMTGARILVGFDHQGRFPWLDVALEWDEDVPLRTKHGHIADDLVGLVEIVVTHAKSERSTAIELPKGTLKLSASEQRRLFARPLVCIHPASGSLIRQWPPASFSQLIDMLLDLQRYNVALIGGSDDGELAEEVLTSASQRERVFNLVAEFSLEELPKLLVRSALFVGNNSGPQHLAAALGIPTVGIHSGVVDATEWGPLGLNAVALRKAMVCSPCFLELPKDCNRGLACLTELSVGHVFQACIRALADRSNGKQLQC